MKRYFLVLLILGILQIGYSQVEEEPRESFKYPKRVWQLGSTISDAVTVAFPVDLNYRYKGNKALGIELNLFSTVLFDDLENYDDLSLTGVGAKIYQKIYLNKSSWNNYLYFRHGLRLDRSELTYNKEDWFPTEQNGNTFLTFENREYTSLSYRIGYDAVFGIELHNDNSFIIDFFVGMSYLEQLSSEDLELSDNFLSPLYSGLRPIGGMRFAFYLDGFSYPKY